MENSGSISAKNVELFLSHDGGTSMFVEVNWYDVQGNFDCKVAINPNHVTHIILGKHEDPACIIWLTCSRTISTDREGANKIINSFRGHF